MKRYTQFTEKQFERMLWLIKSQLQLTCFIKDISNELREFEGKPVWEKVYSIPTPANNVTIIIFSSVDKKTGKVRDKGTDAVRLILEIRKSNGEVFYKHVKKHLRINTLQENLRATISYTMNYFKNNNPRKIS